jgi:hypothetical protein|tara:strand:+ start:350 stop:508 length:159 start_codon:yes stop_codon:yes gene_type:complete
MNQRDPQLKIRLKPEIKSWIKEKAKREDRSQTWLINHYLKEAMLRETTNSAA